METDQLDWGTSIYGYSTSLIAAWQYRYSFTDEGKKLEKTTNSTEAGSALLCSRRKHFDIFDNIILLVSIGQEFYRQIIQWSYILRHITQGLQLATILLSWVSYRKVEYNNRYQRRRHFFTSLLTHSMIVLSLPPAIPSKCKRAWKHKRWATMNYSSPGQQGRDGVIISFRGCVSATNTLWHPSSLLT